MYVINCLRVIDLVYCKLSVQSEYNIKLSMNALKDGDELFRENLYATNTVCN